MKITAIIVAAGKGERAGGDVPKQFAQLGGIAMVAHPMNAFASHPAIAQVIVVVGAGQRDLLAEARGTHTVTVVEGGAERQQSVRAGLEAASGADLVLIHDAARPFLPHGVIDRLIAALAENAGAIPVLPVADTLSRADGSVVDRADLWRVQTPQAFRYDAIMTSHGRWSEGLATDDAQMARAAGFTVAMVAGDPCLEKVTQPHDFATAEQRLAARMISRTGIGFDVHRLEAGEELWLCGVKIPHDKGLLGHSDADVALHALVDAILGAICEGDIGSHFPPSDPQWRRAASGRFVEHARDLVAAKGGIIDHVDLTLICEAPKIGPHRDAMRASVAQLLGVPIARVSVKATTTERLGLTGRGEGIAAQAVVTVRSS
jgi:2-C-methyl-D-erythritol 4-phosphate cytidylyltransferase / 2-C-methyl-D-erythritol 2,4-cyclodiphosphate synthase